MRSLPIGDLFPATLNGKTYELRAVKAYTHYTPGGNDGFNGGNDDVMIKECAWYGMKPVCDTDGSYGDACIYLGNTGNLADTTVLKDDNQFTDSSGPHGWSEVRDKFDTCTGQKVSVWKLWKRRNTGADKSWTCPVARLGVDCTCPSERIFDDPHRIAQCIQLHVNNEEEQNWDRTAGACSKVYPASSMSDPCRQSVVRVHCA